MTSNLDQIVEILNRYQIPYALIGGHAVIAHGYVRATEDVDILIHRTSDGERRLLAALSEMNAQWISDDIDPATGIEKLFPVDERYLSTKHLMMLVTKFGYLDLFDFVPGLAKANVHEVLEQAETIAGKRVVSLAWLREMKRSSQRLKDQLDLENLRQPDRE